MKNDLIPMAVNGRESHNDHKRLAFEMAKEMETRTFDTGARKAIRWAKRAAHRADRRQARDEIAVEMKLYGEEQDMRIPELESVDVEVWEHPGFNVHCIHGEQGCFCLVDEVMVSKDWLTGELWASEAWMADRWDSETRLADEPLASVTWLADRRAK